MRTFILIFKMLLVSNIIFAQNSWTISNSGISEEFNTYDFIVTSSSDIYAVGSLFGDSITPKIYKSTNSGENWTEFSVTGMESHNYLYSASCMAGSKMFINASNSSGTYAIYSSIDGNNWTLSNTGIPEKFNTYDFIVISSSEIYAIGSLFDGTPTPQVYKSMDSGESWTEFSVTGMNSHNYLYSASCMAGSKMFINASNSSGTYAIYSSIDGNNWSLSNTGIPEKFNTYDFIVISSSEIYAIGSLFDGTPIPKIYKSTDSGESWAEFLVTGMETHNYLYSASCMAGSKLFINASSSSGTYAIYSTTSNTSINRLSNFDFSFYPNPANHQINISSIEIIDKIVLFNVQGQIVRTSNDKDIYVGDLPSSTYLIAVIKDESIQATYKIIIE